MGSEVAGMNGRPLHEESRCTRTSGTPGALPYLEQLVASGKLGMKSGEGFRTWTSAEQAALRAKVAQHLKKALVADREG